MCQLVHLSWVQNKSKHQVADKQLANGYYKVKVTAINQGSVHPNSNIIVTSSNEQIVVNDVESKSFTSKTAEGVLNVTDGHIKVLVQLGSDLVFSGGLTVDLHSCTVQPPPQPQHRHRRLQARQYQLYLKPGRNLPLALILEAALSSAPPMHIFAVVALKNKISALVAGAKHRHYDGNHGVFVWYILMNLVLLM